MVIPVHAKLLFSVAPGANNVKFKKKKFYIKIQLASWF